MTELSIIIPFYNEEACAKAVVEELVEVFSNRFDLIWEIIMVNDGSSDTTGQLINTMAQNNACLHAVHLPVNMGQSAALKAGFNKAKGEILGVIDGDGQNDPNDFPGMLQEMKNQKADMMCGIRRSRSDTFVRKVSSKIANKLRSLVLKDHIVDVGCSIRLFRRDCFSKIMFFKNAHRFFPALMRMKGYKVSQMPVNHRSRLKGTSKYGAGINSRLWVGIIDLAGVYWLSKRIISDAAIMDGMRNDRA